MIKYLVKKGVHEPIAMYFRNPYVQKYEECPDAVLDVYHLRNISEGVNSYLKDNLGLETHVNGKGIKNIDLSCNPMLHNHTWSSFDQTATWYQRKSFFSCLFDIRGEKKLPTVFGGSW